MPAQAGTRARQPRAPGWAGPAWASASGRVVEPGRGLGPGAVIIAIPSGDRTRRPLLLVRLSLLQLSLLQLGLLQLSVAIASLTESARKRNFFCVNMSP